MKDATAIDLKALAVHAPKAPGVYPNGLAPTFGYTIHSIQHLEITMITSSPKKFFDLHILGFGYLNRVRELPSRTGSPFLTCNIAALYGPVDAPKYCRFDVTVPGSEAQRLIRQYKPEVDARRKVLIGFRLGDPWMDLFTYTEGEKAGQPGVSWKARLLFVSWIKVDGETVYKANSKDLDESNAEEDGGIAQSPPEVAPLLTPAPAGAASS